MKDDKICINCERYVLNRNYCGKCYPLILKIQKIKSGDLPKMLSLFLKSKGESFIKEESIRQFKKRLELIKDSYVLKKEVGEHELENKINSYLRMLGPKTLGKKNDELRSNLKEKERAYVYN